VSNRLSNNFILVKLESLLRNKKVSYIIDFQSYDTPCIIYFNVYIIT